MLFLHNEPDPVAYRDIIRQACLEDWRYDSQLDEDRAPYLFDVIRATGEPEYYIRPIQEALETIATPQEAENTCRPQLISLAALLTKDGICNSRSAIYSVFERTAMEPEGITGSGYVLVELDGIAGYRFLVELLLRFPQPDDEIWSEISLLDELHDRLGETAAAESLAQLAFDEPHLAPYLNQIQRARADQQRSIADRKQRKTPAPMVPTESQIRDYLDGAIRRKPRMHHVDSAVLERLAAELAQETDRERQLRYLRLFRSPAYLAFPGDPEILLQLIRQTDDERVAWRAALTLEHTSHPAIRIAALEFLQIEDRLLHGVCLLPYNPGADDAERLEAILTRDWDDDTFHYIGMAVTDYIKRNPVSNAISILLICYEKMACAMCRNRVVDELLKRDALPPTLRAECHYDVYSETRNSVSVPRVDEIEKGSLVQRRETDAAMVDTPLITHLYTADPSAHVFENRIYIYPSHDRETPIADNDNGDQYDMNDYHVFSLESIDGPVTDHGVALALEDVPWASKQLWAPDAAYKNNRYYLYFPARAKDGIFRIGVASSDSPAGPFTAEPEPIAGSYSIDPCSFVDTDGQAYLYFGGIWGGQLQCWRTGTFDPQGTEPGDDEPAIGPRVVRLSESMTEFAGGITELSILDESGEPLRAGDHDRRFFEAAWVHKRNDTYYLSYSTGDTHYLVYATSTSPLGPFTYQGRILEPVIGWTTHQSIVEFNGKWYLFHHDASLSGGKNHLRCVKVKEIFYDAAGQIQPVSTS